MWHRGSIQIPQKDGGTLIVHYEVKSYRKNSRYGINRGRISKLLLQVNGECAANYDRGWVKEPNCEAVNMALCILLNHYN